MAGRTTANVFVMAVAVASGEARSRSFISLGRGARLADSSSPMMNQGLNVLDTSQWLSQDSRIRINGFDMPADYDTTRITGSSSSATLVASVRTKRRRALRQILEEEEEEEAATSTTTNDEHVVDPLVIKSIAKPFVPKSVWGRLRGTEFDQPGVIDNLVETGLAMTRPNDNEWISWKAHNKNDDAAANDQDVRVHVGRCSKDDVDEYYGANLPMIKTEAVIRNITPKELAELLLDSSRVQVYNKMSIGRTDIRTVECETGVAKIVRNLTQPPITSKKVQSTTLMHSRQLNEAGAYLVVSRAVTLPNSGEKEEEEHGKSEILLGVNLLEPCDDDASSLKMTAVTHVYSPALPVVLAKRIGVKSAISFVKDIRSVCEDPSEVEIQ